MNSEWWGIYILALHLGFPCGINAFVPGFISDSSGWWPLSFLLFSFLFL
jgi:hypothetical protein